MKNIYLDYAATTPVDPEVRKAMQPYFGDVFGNPSSVHSFGRSARIAIDQSRETIANFLNCQTTEIVFTSGGSESDNLAIRGLIDFIREDSKAKKIPHVITTQFEHHAILNTIKELESDNAIEATYIKPNREGLIDPKLIEKAFQENTVLVSVMYVNNEIGTLQPIREIGKIIERANRDRSQRIYFHTDAVQAAEFFLMDVQHLHVDLLTMTAHKIYGPKGIGLLYVRRGTPIKKQITGGEQEYRMRAGTENTAGIVGFAAAVAKIQKLNVKNKNENSKVKIQNLRNKLINGILESIPNAFLNGSKEKRSPANVNISFLNAEGESILLNLDMEGIAASTGSACTSGALEPSHVLLSLGLKPEDCHGSIRLTLGRETTDADIEQVLKTLPKIIKKLRVMSPFK